MANQPEKTLPAQPATPGGWHTPTGLKTSRRPETGEPEVAEWRVIALPAEMETTPDTVGDWHLPAPEDTPFQPGQEVMLREDSVVLPDGTRPEDLIVDILAQTKKPAPAAPVKADIPTAPRPEDFDLPAAKPAPAQTAPAPEDLDFFTSAVTTAGEPAAEAQPLLPEDYVPGMAADEATVILRPEEGATEVLPVSDLDKALESLEDAGDEEAFKVSELAALASIGEGSQAMTDADLSGLQPDDLTPAQKALFNAATQAEEIMPASQQPVGEDAAEVARKMAQLYASGEAATLDMPSEAAGAQQPGESPAEYARRMAQQFAGSSAGTGAYPASQRLSPAEAELAQKFIDTRNQVAQLRSMYQAGQIGYDDLQNRLRALTILDNNQVWWMLGVESDKWYKYETVTGQWQEASPPVPLESGMGDVLAGSMPYLPDEAAPHGEYSDPYITSGVSPTAGMPAAGGTPVPRPGQPVVDYGATMVGSAYDAEYLPGAEPTLQGVQMYDATMPSASTIPSAGDGVPAPMSTAEPPEYDLKSAYAPTFDELKQREQASVMRYVVIGVIALVACGIITTIAGLVGVQLWYQGEVAEYQEEIDALANYNPPFQTAKILDARGQVIAELNSQQGGAREVVTLENISPYLLHAIISVENETFYEDPGFSFPAIARAFLQNLSAGEIASGASTITQQIARNLILQDTDPTAGRKVKEILVANRIAQQYDKNFILALYVNQFFFGNQSYGVEAAAQFYFGKPARDVNMAEAAMLAGLIQSPAGNDPVVNREQAKTATRNSIRLMLEVGCVYFQHGPWAKGGPQEGQPFCIEPGPNGTKVDINGQEAPLVIVNADGTYSGALAIQLAQVETRPYLPRQARFKYPHFVNFIQSLVEAQFGPDAMFQRGFTIYTTLEPRIQDVAQDALSQQVAALVNNGVNTGAVMVIDPKTGAIRAFVGSPDFNNEQIDGQVDNTRTFQQPGSSIKPVVYAAALEASSTGQYLTPTSILWDVPSTYNIPGQQPYSPVNFDRQFRGPVALRYALQNSLNIPAVKAFEFIGPDRFKEMATRLGLNYVEGSLFGLPSALGANDVRLIDMMKVYATFANNGAYVPLYAIDKITEDAGGVEVEVPLPDRVPPSQKVSPQVAYIMQNILSDDASRRDQFGINGDLTLARLGIPTQNYVAAKSGTSNDNRDLWTLGFTSNAVVGVWLGTYDNAPTVGANSLAAAKVWNRVIEAAISGRAPQPFANPGGVVQGTICRDTGTLADDNCPTRVTDIWIQTQPPPNPGQGFVQILNIDSWTNQLANEWCPENQVQAIFANISDPFAVQWLNTTPAGRAYKQRLGLPDNLAAPPAQACTQGMVLPSVRLNNPSSGQTLTGTVTITGQVSAPDFNRFELLYAPATSPQAFSPITSPSTQQFQNAGSTLGTWNTATLPNGSYIVRLAAYSAAGGYIFKDATVTLNNIPPTPTIAPATPTPVFIPPQSVPTTAPGGFTPLPFDATPTATLGGI